MHSEKIHKKVIIADDKGNIIGAEDMLDAVEKNMIRCASRVYVFNESGQVLIQRRGENIHKPLMLDPSVGGHVDEGESFDEAADREMKEELGLSNLSLEKIADKYYSSGFFSNLYKTIIPDDTEILFDEEEVAEVIWLYPEELDSLILERAEECTFSLKDSWREFRDRLVKI